MEILQITGGRMKVTLTKEDLAEYAMDCVKKEEDDFSSRKALEAVLAVVEAKTGVNMTKGKIFVQLYPSKDGGCELFIVRKSEYLQSDCAVVPAVKNSGGYLCAVEKGREEKVKSLFEQTGVTGELFSDRKGERIYFWCAAEERHLLLLEEHGQKADAALGLYLSEHFVSLGRLSKGETAGRSI